VDFKSILFKNKEFYPNLMKNSNTILIVAVIILLISNLFFGYMLFFHNNQGRLGPRGDFPQMQLTDEQIQEVTSFFNSTTDITEIKDYCDVNRMNCFYYCRTVNPDHEICSQLMQGRPNSQQAQKLN
jgi:hypothetical protein